MYLPHVNPIMRFNGVKPPQKMDFSQGLLWRIFKDEAGRTWVNHCGSVRGFGACLIVYPAEDVVVAVACNTNDVGPGRADAENIAKSFLPR
jgi:hypothetical protein